MPKIKIAIKVICCLFLCLPLLELNWQKAAAQTGNPPPPPAISNPAAKSPSAAAPALPPASPQGGQKVTPTPGEPTSPHASQKNPVPSQPALSATALPPLSPPEVRISVLGMVRNSDPIVQAVMLFLLLCSAASWAAFIYKSFALAIARRNTRQFSDAFQNAVTIGNVGDVLKSVSDGPARRMWLAAKQEWDLTLHVAGTPLDAHQTNRLLQRLVLAMGSAQERSLSRLGNWMGLLATVGSTAPFIGLFGTVWGILDSFEHISASSNTSLTVVAPGIAEALLATAVGLFAAIPATMFYNRFAREIGKITGMLDNVTAELIVFASRDVERFGK